MVIIGIITSFLFLRYLIVLLCHPILLHPVRSHLLKEHKRLSEELSQTKQVIHSYETLGEEFLQLSQQYHVLKGEIENKQWALSELTKTMT